MVTDLLTIERFFREGKRGFAFGCVAMVGLCAILQLFIVYLQNRKRGVARTLQESLLVLSCLKPGVEESTRTAFAWGGSLTSTTLSTR